MVETAMTRHVIYTADSAAEAARKTLQAIEDKVGFLPNIAAVLGGAPNVLEALNAVNTGFADGLLTPMECEIVQLAVSVQNTCGYCVAGHTAFATELGMSEPVIAALRANRTLTDSRQEALRRFARTLAAGKGRDADAEYDAFLNAGYSAGQALDVILGVSAKMFTNTLAILLNLPLDDSFEPFAWSPDEAKRAVAA